MGLLSGLLGGTPRDRFARTVMKRLKALGWTGPEPEYDAEHFSLRFDDGSEDFLQPAFIAWTRAPGAEKDKQIDIHLDRLLHPFNPASLEEAAPHLMPAIRSHSQVVSSWLGPGLEQDRGAYDGAMQALCDDLAVIVGIDHRVSTVYVTRKHLDAWNCSFEQVLEIAVENLRAKSPSKFTRHPTGFWRSDYGDQHDAERLLLPHLFEPLELNGDPVAVALGRFDLVVAGSEDTAALAAMAAFCDESFANAHRPIACLPIVFKDGEWRRYETEREHLMSLDRLRIRQSLEDYDNQRRMLEAWNARHGERVHVAAVNAGRHKERFETFTTWAQGVDTLLPRVDLLNIPPPKGEPQEGRARRWADVEAEFGPFSPEPDLYPPRYRFRTWPEDAWARLGRLPGLMGDGD